MLPKHNNDGFLWYSNLSEAKPHYTSIPVKTFLQFFILKPRASTLTKENLIPFDDIAYCYKSPQEEKYYVKRSRNYLYEEFLFQDSEEIRILRSRIDAGHVYLLLTLHNIADVSESLKRAYKGQFKQDGKLEYPLYLQLLESSIKFADYKDVGKSLVGYRTVCHSFEVALADMWQTAKK
jgi:hypothetical protein